MLCCNIIKFLEHFSTNSQLNWYYTLPIVILHLRESPTRFKLKLLKILKVQNENY